MIKSEIIRQTSEYTPVSTELEKALEAIQSAREYKVLNVFETKVNAIPRMTEQAFIILYETECANETKAK